MDRVTYANSIGNREPEFSASGLRPVGSFDFPPAIQADYWLTHPSAGKLVCVCGGAHSLTDAPLDGIVLVGRKPQGCEDFSPLRPVKYEIQHRQILRAAG